MSIQADQIYHSFLVRCWLIPPATTDELPTWRFELRDVTADPQKERFSDLEQLKEFVAAKLAAIAVSSKPDSKDDEKEKEGNRSRIIMDALEILQ
jgi:hypothetical protein